VIEVGINLIREPVPAPILPDWLRSDATLLVAPKLHLRRISHDLAKFARRHEPPAGKGWCMIMMVVMGHADHPVNMDDRKIIRAIAL
jgi:hypothetical protein